MIFKQYNLVEYNLYFVGQISSQSLPPIQSILVKTNMEVVIDTLQTIQQMIGIS
jgi:hypothetical protein